MIPALGSLTVCGAPLSMCVCTIPSILTHFHLGNAWDGLPILILCLVQVRKDTGSWTMALHYFSLSKQQMTVQDTSRVVAVRVM